MLERYHVAEAARLLNDVSVAQNIVAEACSDELDPAAAAVEMMQEISAMVLATDLAGHVEFVAKFRDILAGGIMLRTTAHKTMTLHLLVKAADMMFCAKPFFISRQWTCRLVSEFMWQGAPSSNVLCCVPPCFRVRGITPRASAGDVERNFFRIPVTPFMDRTKPDVPHMMLSFITLLATPLLDCVGRLLPNVRDMYQPHLDANLRCGACARVVVAAVCLLMPGHCRFWQEQDKRSFGAAGGVTRAVCAPVEPAAAVAAAAESGIRINVLDIFA